MEQENETRMEEDELFEKIKSGEVSLRKIEKYTDANTAVKLRRQAVEEMSDISFKNIQNHNIDAEEVARKNIENMIGAVQIPLGVAGPLKVNGEYADGDYHIPLATTEGALVASINRGCSVITRSDGANVRIFQDVMTRAPAFKVENVARAQEFVEWIKKPDTIKHMQDKISDITSHGELVDVDPYVLGNTVYLRFSYDTKDAMGMNMVTIATNTLVDLIEDEFGADPISLSGNMCTDKKPAAINSIQGRGKTVVAETEIPKKVIEDRLKSTPEEMAEVNYRKNLLGSARAGSLGYNAHAANVIAAMNIACGQDTAHVVEGSNTITTMEVTKYGDLYCSVTLPSLLVGTVGGGTGIGTQKDCLDLLGVAGSGHPPGSNAKKLAEIIASSVLAGEISLIGAQAAGHLARAHAELGRGGF
ncbi:3-hydroxy-3-methylglutaryl Coenzyme A reductase [Methanohalobium evestigatum Z-7303]|uniref:3-hydroxy-3-methylglutaryl coenzyme A reductase n=1 Tax=Methanohalobium evestigatum (strain ATCC BAA-1072 / DSM 3721 / NBRC 107634 / OCM 161 / Z-7303) TaxID=644295 RepID=D7E9F2_METEZ|nr:hydroxymethylglutaryl-CoA reductase (NADPH) [Methanohalobium evestigatum]ADI74224.1 3-hydroxy-3-methylglutaryl Coenzyme A reductase [Methanohalobium evestigatum Z-7303]